MKFSIFLTISVLYLATIKTTKLNNFLDNNPANNIGTGQTSLVGNPAFNNNQNMALSANINNNPFLNTQSFQAYPQTASFYPQPAYNNFNAFNYGYNNLNNNPVNIANQTGPNGSVISDPKYLNNQSYPTQSYPNSQYQNTQAFPNNQPYQNAMSPFQTFQNNIYPMSNYRFMTQPQPLTTTPIQGTPIAAPFNNQVPNMPPPVAPQINPNMMNGQYVPTNVKATEDNVYFNTVMFYVGKIAEQYNETKDKDMRKRMNGILGEGFPEESRLAALQQRENKSIWNPILAMPTQLYRNCIYPSSKVNYSKFCNNSYFGVKNKNSSCLYSFCQVCCDHLSFIYDNAARTSYIGELLRFRDPQSLDFMSKSIDYNTIANCKTECKVKFNKNRKHIL
jgi:hypothetical protein